jgi:ferritin-like metal-binding protein YciE
MKTHCYHICENHLVLRIGSIKSFKKCTFINSHKSKTKRKKSRVSQVLKRTGTSSSHKKKKNPNIGKNTNLVTTVVQ